MNNTLKSIIELANSKYNINWQVKMLDYTPFEALKAVSEMGLTVARQNEETAGITGLTIPQTSTIVLFLKDVKSFGTQTWTLAHELGHAVHFTNHPEIVDAEQREQFADHIANELLDELGL